MLPTEIKLCCRTLGIAILAILPSISPENSGARSSVSTVFSLAKTNTSANMQLTPWHMKVAHATPATPILNAVTNNMSAPMLLSDDAARK